MFTHNNLPLNKVYVSAYVFNTHKRFVYEFVLAVSEVWEGSAILLNLKVLSELFTVIVGSWHIRQMWEFVSTCDSHLHQRRVLLGCYSPEELEITVDAIRARVAESSTEYFNSRPWPKRWDKSLRQLTWALKH